MLTIKKIEGRKFELNIIVSTNDRNSYKWLIVNLRKFFNQKTFILDSFLGRERDFFFLTFLFYEFPPLITEKGSDLLRQFSGLCWNSRQYCVDAVSVERPILIFGICALS